MYARRIVWRRASAVLLLLAAAIAVAAHLVQTANDVHPTPAQPGLSERQAPSNPKLPVPTPRTTRSTPPPVRVEAPAAIRVRSVTVYAQVRNIRPKPTTVGARPLRVVHYGQKVPTIAIVKGQDPYHDGRNYWVKLPNATFMWAGSTNAWAVYHVRVAKPSRSETARPRPVRATHATKVAHATKIAHTAKATATKRPTKAAHAVKSAKVVATRSVAAKRAPSARAGHYVLPVSHYRITARFGSGGSHWSLNYHTGLDFAAPTGTPVRAVAPGKVSHVTDRSYGHQALLRLSNGSVFVYAHLSRYAKSGRVRAGDVIGYIGTTGNSTGPHLHLEYRPHGGGFGSGIDPQRWFVARGVHVPSSR